MTHTLEIIMMDIVWKLFKAHCAFIANVMVSQHIGAQYQNHEDGEGICWLFQLWCACGPTEIQLLNCLKAFSRLIEFTLTELWETCADKFVWSRWKCKLMKHLHLTFNTLGNKCCHTLIYLLALSTLTSYVTKYWLTFTFYCFSSPYKYKTRGKYIWNIWMRIKWEAKWKLSINDSPLQFLHSAMLDQVFACILFNFSGMLRLQSLDQMEI